MQKLPLIVDTAARLGSVSSDSNVWKPIGVHTPEDMPVWIGRGVRSNRSEKSSAASEIREAAGEKGSAVEGMLQSASLACEVLLYSPSCRQRKLGSVP